MTKKTLFLVIGVATVFAGGMFVIAGFSKQRIVEVDPAFSRYISGYTSGAQSRIDPVAIEFSNPIPEHISEKQLTELFTIDPAVEGTVKRVDDRTVEFHAKKPLETNRLYTVSFALDKVEEVESGFEEFEFQFSTFPQQLNVELGTIQSYYDATHDLRYLTGTIISADYADSAALLNTINATLDGKSLRAKTVSYNGLNQLEFIIDSIQRTTVERKLVFNWNGKSIGAKSSGREEFSLLALGDYRVTETKVVTEDEGDQYLEIEFSEELLPQQNLSGIIELEGEDHLTYHIEGNVVRAYLSNFLIGDKRLYVANGIKDALGHRMNLPYAKDVTFYPPGPRIRLHSGGSILPNSQGLIFPFETVSLKSVDVRIIKIKEKNVHHFLQVNDLDGEDELSRFGKVVVEKKIQLNLDKGDSAQWTSHVLDLSKLMQPELGAIYRVSIKFDRSDSKCGCESTVSNSDSEEEERSDWNENDWDAYMFSYDEYESWGGYEDQSNPCEDDYYRGKAVNRNILASDLGLVFKLDQDKRGHVFVSNMVTAQPIPNASIEFYDYTSDVISSAVSDANGMVAVQLTKKPFLLIAKHGSQRGYLKLNDHFTNSTSKFDVEGENLEKAVKGFFYGERAVWRPGDSLFLSFVLNDPLKSIPLDHPIQFELSDPNGRTVSTYTAKKDAFDSYVFRTATRSSSPTGYYSVSARIGNHYFEKTVRIETVKPNRLKVNLVVNQLKADSSLLQAKWLHGASARDLRANVARRLRPIKSVFAAFPSYCFDSPIRSSFNREEVLFDGALNAKGEAKIRTELRDMSSAAGFVEAIYTSRVFEKGGDFSISVQTEKITPFKTMLGLDAPDADFSESVEVDKKHRFDVIALSSDGKKVTAEKVQLKIYRIYKPWWSEQDANDLLSYVTRTANIVVLDSMISVKNGQAAFNFGVNGNNYGNYLITLTDLEGKHETGELIHFDYPYWSRTNRSGNDNMKMLDFASNKNSYEVGESVQLTIPSPENGRALVSIETGERVVKKFWQSTTKGDNKIEFTVEKGMFPNAYVHVMLIQPHHTTTNDRPIRMYGIVPIEIDDPVTHLTPVISMKESIRPNQVASIEVGEESGRKMTYTLAIVDDGLLDITGFKTPNPWKSIYAKRSLGVQTWDMYDDVIGAYAGSLRNMISIGGDGGEGNISEAPKANRFKPMVHFLGPFTLEAGSRKKHSVEIPNYVGSVRVMVVAQHDGAYGEAEKTVTVKQPVMVLATLPRVLGPTEELSIPITVFAMENSVKDVSVTVEGNDFMLLSQKKFNVHFTQTGDDLINVPLKIAKKVGIATLKVTARCGNEVAIHEIEVDVRAPNPIIYTGNEYTLAPGEERILPIEFTGLEGTNKAIVEVSRILPLGLNKRLDYLIQYPHGCVEQTTSSVFPQLFLSQIMEVSDKEKATISNNIKEGILRLQTFQTSDGGFAYWPGDYSADEWGTNYAGHFLLEAESRGYSVPSDLKSLWLSYQKNAANEIQLNGGNELTQAYRLFVLALSGNPELGAMNQLRERGGLSDEATWRLSSAYYLVGQKEVAKKMVESLSTVMKSRANYASTYGSSMRDRAMILESLSLMKETVKSKKLVEEISREMNSNTWQSTQTTAYALLGITTYYDAGSATNSLSYSSSLNGSASERIQTKAGVSRMVYTDKEIRSKGSVRLKNTGTKTLYVKLISQGIPLEYKEPKKQNNLQLSLVYRNMEGKVIDPTKIVQGMDFKVEVKIKNPGKKGDLTEIALSHLFPNGWEIHNARLFGGTEVEVDYQDIRDDRVYSYFDLAAGESKTIVVQLNASYLGKFYLPAVQAETMYDHLISATLPGKWVNVVPESKTPS